MTRDEFAVAQRLQLVLWPHARQQASVDHLEIVYQLWAPLDAGEVEQALKAADRVMPKTKTWRTDAVQIRGETLVTIKHWPKGSTELCAERRWLKTGTKRKKKVEHGED